MTTINHCVEDYGPTEAFGRIWDAFPECAAGSSWISNPSHALAPHGRGWFVDIHFSGYVVVTKDGDLARAVEMGIERLEARLEGRPAVRR